jgi:START domain
MKLNLKYAIVLLSALTVFSYTLADTAHQDKISIDRDGVKVWTFKKPNNPIMNFRATTVLESTLSGAVALVMDVDRSVEWAPYTGTVMILDPYEPGEAFSFRMNLNFPFPLSNRDVVLVSRLAQTADGVVTIKNKAVEDPRAPVRSNFIRIKNYEGLWQFKPLGKSASGQPLVEATVSGFADPNGNLPIGIANLFVKEQPFKMLRNMQKYVQAEKYQNASIAGVREF